MNAIKDLSDSRKRAVNHITRYLQERSHPRLFLLAILVMTGIVGALASFVMLHTGVNKMYIRYPIAATFGYLAFLISLRVWRDHLIRQPHFAFEIEKIVGDSSADTTADPENKEVDPNNPLVGGIGDAIEMFSVDAPFIISLLISVIVLVFGLIVMFISTAPILLAEVLLDGLIMAGIYNRLKKAETDNLLGTAFRVTWLQAIFVVLGLLLIGVLFEAISPTARSIGEVVRPIVN